MHSCREKKKEREREDLWRKMQDLSIKNANKEGISLGNSLRTEFLIRILVDCDRIYIWRGLGIGILDQNP